MTRLGAFALVLVASFGVGAALGAALPDLGRSSSDPPAAPAEPAGPAPGEPAPSVPAPPEPGPSGGHQP